MKKIFTILALLMSQSLVSSVAAANTISMDLVSCTYSAEKLCALVYEDHTTGKKYEGQEMDFITNGSLRDLLYGAFETAKGVLPRLNVEGKVYTVFSTNSKLKIERVLMPDAK